jgi:hypothetical protein
MRRAALSAVIAITALSSPGLLFASPSGLNNIPTADFTPDGVLVLQTYSFSQSGAKTTGFLGAKYGLGDGIEVGADGQLAASPTGPLTLQAKKTWPVEDARIKLCLGIANITADTGENPLYPYGVVGAKLCGQSRGHLGFAPQKGNHEWLLGYDYTLSGGTMLRTDVVRGISADNKHTLYSLGGLMPTKFGAVEGWVTRAINNSPGGSDATVYTLKLDYAFQP